MTEVASLRRPSPRRLSGLHGPADVRRAARRALPRIVDDYVAGGADDEVTLRRNVRRLDELALLPRGGRWVAEPELRTTVLGHELAMPVVVAPVSGMRLVWPDGDVALARGAAAAGVPAVAAASAGTPLEQVRDAGARWLQLYRFRDRRLLHELVERADAAGYEVLVATIDTPVAGNREREPRNGLVPGRRPDLRGVLRLAPQVLARPAWLTRIILDGVELTMPNARRAGTDATAPRLTAMTESGGEPQGPTWEDVAWARARWPGPLVVKGVLTVEDARRAVDVGADAVVVSNHGGRQLDHAPATIDVLPAIAEVAGHDLEVLLDGGIRRGTDVVKALASGARAVLVGRLAVWGLAVAGAAGVTHALTTLRAELTRTLRLLGCDATSLLGPEWLARADAPAPAMPTPHRPAHGSPGARLPGTART